ncbi:uncharacterized protein [Halyomorpha halys]|uniref:uncharacterized protein n=1 Tax=Halyomorpha halys TaxID=286706 RepID=UPI0006D508B5|nr:uncharacterized protein LOC106689208 [Halyomorpha halys]
MKLCYNTDNLYLLEIMDFPVLEIREEEFCKVRKNYDAEKEVIFKSGKSCLFSAQGLKENLDFLIIHVQVAREKVNKKSTSLMVLGSTFVQLDGHFVEVLRSGGCQNSRCIEETYPLYSKENCCFGNVSFCIRLSALGNMILTSVTGGKENEPFAVKGEGVAIEQGPVGAYSSYGRLLGGTDQPLPQPYPQYGSQKQLQGLQEVMNMSSPNQMYGPGQTAYMGPTNQMYSPAHNAVMDPTNQIMGPPKNAFMSPTNQMMSPPQNAYTSPFIPAYGPAQKAMLGFQGMQPHAPTQERPPAQSYIPLCGQIAIRPSSYSSSEKFPPPPSKWPPDMFCSCDYPLPPGFKEPPRPQSKKKKKKKDKSPCPLELKGNYCLNPDCPMGYPALPGFSLIPQGKKKTCAQFPLQAEPNNYNMMLQ